MSFLEIATACGVAEYPPALDAYYPIDASRKRELCSAALIDRLQSEMDLFGAYYPDVIAGFLDLEKDPLRKSCMDAYSLFIKDNDAETARRLRCPERNGSLGSNMFGLLMHLPAVDATYRHYRQQGFTHEEASGFFHIYKIFLREVKEFRHGFVGFTPDIARWMTYCTKGEMYYPGFGGFYYQAIVLPKDSTPVLLRHRNSGKILPVYGNGQVIHPSGVPLGSEGATDPANSFSTSYCETDSAYCGHPVIDCRVTAELETFSKENWELVFSPGVDAISMHVFFEADLSPDAVAASQKAACEIAGRAFPGKTFQAIYCSSWLLHPAVTEILGENSRITCFGSRFVKFPAQSGAQAVFHYAFPGEHPTNEDLPENSRLQRGLKQRILHGESINDTSGILLL